MKAILRLLATTALLLLAASVFLPFLQMIWRGMAIPEEQLGPETFWSFRKTEVLWRLGEGTITKEYWFTDYWTRVPFITLILSTQILAILSGALSTLRTKMWLFTMTTVFNMLTISLMLIASEELPKPSGPLYSVTFQAGFWVALSSTIIFFICTILSLSKHK
jgi:hypothetical protein